MSYFSEQEAEHAVDMMAAELKEDRELNPNAVLTLEERKTRALEVIAIELNSLRVEGILARRPDDR